MCMPEFHEQVQMRLHVRVCVHLCTTGLLSIVGRYRDMFLYAFGPGRGSGPRALDIASEQASLALVSASILLAESVSVRFGCKVSVQVLQGVRTQLTALLTFLAGSLH